MAVDKMNMIQLCLWLFLPKMFIFSKVGRFFDVNTCGTLTSWQMNWLGYITNADNKSKLSRFSDDLFIFDTWYWYKCLLLIHTSCLINKLNLLKRDIVSTCCLISFSTNQGLPSFIKNIQKVDRYLEKSLETA